MLESASLPYVAGAPTASNPWLILPAVVVQRPNNAVAYAANQVYGPAADARIEIPNVALFAGQSITMQIHVTLPDGTSVPASGEPQFFPFASQPATIIGDQGTFNLSDADIALNGRVCPAQVVLFTTGAYVLVNTGAGLAGRRVTLVTNANTFRLDGTSLWLYLVMRSAYNGLANQTLTLLPFVRRF